MTSWKTTLLGVLTAACYLGYKLLTHQPITGQDLIFAAGLAGIGSAAKDAAVHSTTNEVQAATIESKK